MNLHLQSCQYFVATAFNSSVQLLYISGIVMLIALLVRAYLSFYRTQKIKNKLLTSVISTPPTVQKICQKYSISLRKISVIKSNQYIAVSIGFLHPQIIISTKVLADLSPKELTAVLLHEQFHTKQYHSLFTFSMIILQKVLVLFPFLSDVTNHFICKLECAADRYVVSEQQTSTHLKQAMKVFITADQDYYHHYTTENISHFAANHLHKRLTALRGKPITFQFSRLKLVLSLLSCVLLGAVMIGNTVVTSQVSAINTATNSNEINQSTAAGNCTMMSCATECIHTRNSTRQYTVSSANLNKQMSLPLTE